MDAIKMIEGRRSVRKYKDQKVDLETINKIIDAARWAPSWGNKQIARYTVVQDPEIIKNIAEKGVLGFTYNIGTLHHAHGVIVVSYVKGKSGKLSEDEYATDKAQTWEMFDAGLACQTFCLAAYEYGIGTCIFGMIDDISIAKIVSLPEDETVACLIVFGYPDEDPKIPPRHSVEEITRYL